MNQKELLKLFKDIPRDDKIKQIKVLNSYLQLKENINLKDVINTELWRHNFSHVNIKDIALNDAVVSLVSSYVYLLEDSHKLIKEKLILERNQLLDSPFSFFYKNKIKKIDELLDILDLYNINNLSSVIPLNLD